MVRAKFECKSITLQQDWRDRSKKLHTVRLEPVTSDSEENAKFWAATPGGAIELTCIDPAAAQFELGKQYYVDFTPAE